MRNLVILSFIALMCACLMSNASPNTFKLIEETENECTQVFEVTFKDTNSRVSVNIITIDIDGLKTTQYKTFGTLQDVIVYFEASMIEDFFYLEISGKKYMFDRKQKGFGYTYNVLDDKENLKCNVNPFNFIKNKINKKPRPKKETVYQYTKDMLNVTGRL